jgi:hypothetical protein
MTTLALLAELRARGVALRVEGGQLLARGVNGVPELVALIREHKPELIAALESEDLPDQRPVPPSEQATILEQAEALLARVGRERATKLVTALDAFQWARRRGMRGRERAALSALADAVVALGAEVAR